MDLDTGAVFQVYLFLASKTEDSLWTGAGVAVMLLLCGQGVWTAPHKTSLSQWGKEGQRGQGADRAGAGPGIRGAHRHIALERLHPGHLQERPMDGVVRSLGLVPGGRWVRSKGYCLVLRPPFPEGVRIPG